jgi:hypothetical protein
MLIDHGQVFIFIILDKLEKHPKSVCAYQRPCIVAASFYVARSRCFIQDDFNARNVKAIVNLIPLEWLDWQDTDERCNSRSLSSVLSMRLNHSQIFIKEAKMQEKHLYEYW